MTRILCFSDLHCNPKMAQQVVDASRNVDFVIGAGDFANMRKGLHVTLDILRQIEKPTIVVPGNGESVDELREACDGWNAVHVLHGEGTEIDGQSFYGIGGGIPVTPFGSWSYDFSEDEAEALLSDCPDDSILVSHSPPYGAVDVTSSGQHVGSSAVRDVVDSKKPTLVVCGHIHDCGGQTATIGKTLVLNAGPDGIVVEFVNGCWRAKTE